MATLKIVLADPDEKYLQVLQRSFRDELKEKASVEMITDRAYFTQLFCSPQSLDLLVIAEDWYEPGLERHGIANLVALTVNQDEPTLGGHLSIYKYDAVRTLFERIYQLCRFHQPAARPSCAAKLIVLYSPIGGSGTTTAAVGLGLALARQKKKVLFLGTDGLQNFQHLLPAQRLPNGAERPLRNDDGKGEVFAQLMPLLQTQGGMHYLPPFWQPPAALRWKAEHWINLCQFVRKSKQFDFIIMDCSSDFSAGNSKLLGPADLRIIVAGQSPWDVSKLRNFTRSFDSSVGRTEYICGRYDKTQANCLLEESIAAAVQVREYIEDCAALAAPEGLLRPNALDRLTALTEGG